MQYRIDPIPSDLPAFTVTARSVAEAAHIAAREIYGPRVRAIPTNGDHDRPGRFQAWESLRTIGTPFEVSAGRATEQERAEIARARADADRARFADLSPRCGRCNTSLPLGVPRRYRHGRAHCRGCVA